MNRRAVRAIEKVAIPSGALALSLVIFGVFVALAGADPFEVYYEMFRGGFGTWFSFQNTLQRSAPLMLTALCAVIPAHLGLIVIGGEGALLLGGLAAVIAGRAMGDSSPMVASGAVVLAGALAGGGWIAFSGALRAFRGVNETISSLLLNYIAIALFNHWVEGALRDPTSLNKPSTRPIGDAAAIGNLPGMDVHWGLAFGLVACVLAYFLIMRSVHGFAARMIGGNARAAALSGIDVTRLTVALCFAAGAAAGIAGAIEVGAVHHTANATLIAGYGYTGVLVAFLARQHPLAVIPISLLLGGINASGGLLQRTFHLPDATVKVLQGILFIVILASETVYGRFDLRRPRKVASPVPAATDAEADHPVKGAA
ncbi:MAG TPA: ABC transporter permease [Polyangiaceae bacterium]|nr:ABC transporter permease [Polyangiaceae bacterium]